MNSDNTPVIIGAAQITQHKDIDNPLDPLNLIAKVCKNVILKLGKENLQNIIDTIYMSTISSWVYGDPPEKLSRLLEITPQQYFIAPISGNTPQLLINKAAKAISSGESNCILITGGEASYSKYRANKNKISLEWPKPPPGAVDKARKAIIYYLSEFENKYNLKNPTFIYALIETALRSSSGRNLQEHLDYIGKRYERFSSIASENPYSWIQRKFNAEEIITPSSENRIVCHPYTKRMVSNLYVDQAAAIIITNESIAKNLSLERKFWVYPMGGADIHNIFYMTQRPQLYDSPAIKEASKLALKQAGLKLEDIDLFDLYSCFPCMVEIARQEIGIPNDDPRDLTITGGLSFFGGPFTSYSMHPIVTAVDLIRKNPSTRVMILANGGYNTSESIGIYGNKPPALSWKKFEYNDIQERINAEALPEPVEEANGVLNIEAYTIIYDRNGSPEIGIVMGKLESGKRTFATISSDSKTLSKLEKEELVGKTFFVKFNNETKQNNLNIEF
ncbi:MAG: hypothetical protein ACFFCV_22065 [Promethearchaeota archaeon]